ncbi:polysaccharide biosynthesis protein [Thiocapsa sp.]|uniref:polysaccharide biosynthesis protein n=1 Tax=Thiocapsa sp. TaxID=2024551 RepID=UPI00359363D1
MNPLLDRLRSRTAAFSLRDSRRAYFPAGFVDDKPRRQGGEVHDVPVLGPTEAIPEIVAREEIDLLLLAVPSATAKEMRRLVELCEGTGRPFRTVPELRNLMSAQVSISQLRPVSIEDLLGRDPVSLDWEGIRCGLAGRVVLVTGAGGSIGSELVRQLAAAGPSRLILVDNGEYNLYRIEMELLGRFPQLRFTRHLVDVADAAGLDAVFAAERQQILFHAAAHKHVPMLEDLIRAAVRNNLTGTRLVAETAARWSCERFFMTIPEACQLIMQAALIGDDGETFVLDMGEPVKIRYLAEQMIRLSGREPGEDIAIHYIGLRPGEKLYEELFYDSEDLIATGHPKIRVARGSDGLIAAAPHENVATLEQAAAVGDRAAMVTVLRAMLPGWYPESVPKSDAGSDRTPRSTEAVRDRRNADA